MIWRCIIWLILLVIAGKAMAQEKITGQVMTEDGLEAIGASVYWKNTSTGTITDIEGKFTLELPADFSNPVLVVSFVGYKTYEQAIGAQRNLEITLAMDDEQLDEIIVVGYSSQIKSNVSGAISTVKSKELEALPVAGIDQALQGRAAGVSISQVTGAPGEGVAVRIRGIGSLNSSNDPLYIVDGVPTRDVLNILSVNDIESISILKDASAAAIYGSRANNGVVLITTKKGKADQTRITINSQVGVQRHGRLTPMTNRDEYIEMYNEAANNDNAFVTDDLFKRALIDESTASALPDENHLEAIFRPAMIHNHAITASGGGDKTQYLLSLNYFNQEGIIIGSAYDRVNGRANINSAINDRVTTGLTMNISRANTSVIGSSGDGLGGNGGSIVRYAFFRTPAIPIKDAEGNYVDLPAQPSFFGDGYNPVGLADYQDNTRITDRYFGKAYVSVKLAEGLKLTSNFGMDFQTMTNRRFDRMWGTNNRINNPNRLFVLNERLNTWTNNTLLEYTPDLPEVHQVNVLAGAEAIQTTGSAFSATERNFPDQNPNLVYLGNGLAMPNVGESTFSYSLLSFFGKADYVYNSRYTLAVSARRDGSSRLAEGNRWGTFYSASAGWNLHNEAFFPQSNLINQLRMRLGYGTLGNQEIGNYAYSDLIGIGYNYPFNGVESDGYAVTRLGNTNVKWETSSQWNAGIDFELFRGELYGTLDVFHKVTSDMLVREPNPPSSGYAEPSWVNNGEVLNQGIELLLGARKTFGALGLNASANGAYLRNEVLELAAPIAGGRIGTGPFTTRTEVGHPIGSFYMLEMDGIFQTTREVATSAFQSANVRPGDVKFVDQNGDGTIDDADRKHVGQAFPKITAGLNLAFDYKRLDLGLFFQGAYGFQIYNVAFHDIEGFYRPFNLTKDYYDNRWTGEGTSNDYPRASWSSSNNNVRVSTRFLRDGSYTRLKNVQVGYTFSPEAAAKLRLRSLRVYAAAFNVLTFTQYPGLDPEMTTSDNATAEGDLSRGLDWGTYPAAVSYNFGINLSF